jgi:hypothetical protein
MRFYLDGKTIKGGKFMSNTMISAREALVPGSIYDRSKIKPHGRKQIFILKKNIKKKLKTKTKFLTC